MQRLIPSVLGGIVAVLGLADASGAQPAGITREMIATALPVEGAPLAEPGPYKAMSEPAFGSPGHVVYRPADLVRSRRRTRCPSSSGATVDARSTARATEAS